MKPWKLISKKELKFGEHMPIEERVYELPDRERVEFSVVTHADVALVIPVTGGGKVVMVEQFKPGAGEVTIEFPGGRVEREGEDMMEVAKRELREETGFECKRLDFLGETITYPTKGTERISHYVGYGAKKVGEQNLDEHERIEMREFEEGEIEKMIRDGRINTGPSIASWYLWKAKK